MRRFVLLAIAIGAACALAACGGVSDNTCTTNDDCVEGRVCDGEGKCVQREPLTIVTKSLPDATVGVAYRVVLQATGGIEPYKEWTLKYEPGFLSVDPDSGELTGTPESPGSDLTVGVEVSDSSASQQTASAQLLITVLHCVEAATQTCYEVEGTKCKVGRQVCADGEWGACTDTSFSDSFDHCGPECGACDATVADTCTVGTCTCDENPACIDGRGCCQGACTDLQSDDLNCGSCETDCAERVVHADNPHCEQGRCEYNDCDPDYLDLDGDRANGCEYERDVDNCAAVGESCESVVENATGLGCVLDPDSGDYHCDFSRCVLGFLDCDEDTHNGCERSVGWNNCGECDLSCNQHPDGNECLLTQDDEGQDIYRCGCNDVNNCGPQDSYQCCDETCYSLRNDEHCGDCDTDCALSADGPRCLFDGLVCGCLEHEDCAGLGDLCCDNKCIPFDAENCGDCGRICEAHHGGPFCDVPAGQCYCSDDTECNTFAGGQQQCVGEGLAARCECNEAEGACSGGPGWQCCDVEGQLTCVDVLTDREHCGRCGVDCATGMNCVDGACGCRLTGVPPLPFCPGNSSAPDCNTNMNTRCGCDQNPDGAQFACQEGRICCDGNAGGTGGPGGGPDTGCCWKPCGANTQGSCLY